MLFCLCHLHISMDGKTERTFGMSDRCTNKWPQWHIASEHQSWEKYPKKAIFKKRLKKLKKKLSDQCTICLLIFVCIQAQTTNQVIFPWDLDGFQCLKVYFCQMTSMHHLLIKYKQIFTNKSKFGQLWNLLVQWSLTWRLLTETYFSDPRASFGLRGTSTCRLSAHYPMDYWDSKGRVLPLVGPFQQVKFLQQ